MITRITLKRLPLENLKRKPFRRLRSSSSS